MEKWFSASPVSLFAIILSAIGVYLAVIFLTQLAGKRSFTKMSSFDFAMTISIGAMIGTTVLSPSVSLLQGVTGLTAIFLLEIFSNFLRKKVKLYRKTVDNEPMYLMKGSQIIWENLESARITEGDLRAQLRRNNVQNVSQVKAVVIESTGDISVLKDINSTGGPDDWILMDVKE
ncbi:MAG TPA: YetF domain-containing protein [Gillisia sp.]|nr:YetF domain-containing protein [Gillisia sp.]